MNPTIRAQIALVDRMSPVLNTVQKNTERMADSARRAGSAFRFDSGPLTRSKGQIQDIQTALAGVVKKQHEWTGAVGESNGKFGAIIGKLKQMAGVYLSMKGLKILVSTTDDMTSIQARLAGVVDEQHNVDQLNQMIYESAQRSRSSYMDTANAVAKLGANAQDAFADNNELVAFAEIVNKSFTVAGTGAEEAKNAMLQLTQAMGSGVLRGDELNSIFEQAPILVQKIADYMGQPVGQIRKMASEGQITADIVKSAMFAAADDIDERFGNMPKTFAQIGTELKNNLVMALAPAMTRLREFASSDTFNRFVSGATNAIRIFAFAVTEAVTFAINLIDKMAMAWDVLKYPIMAVVGYMALYKLALIGTAVAGGAVSVASSIAAAAQNLFAGSTGVATAAQSAFNAALYACPISWIIVLIIAVIGLLAFLISKLVDVEGTSVTVVEAIVGMISAAIAFIVNAFIGFANTVIANVEALANIFLRFAEFLGNVFKHPLTAALRLFESFASGVLRILSSCASAIDAVFGSNLAGVLSGWQSKISSKVDGIVAKAGGYKKEKEVHFKRLSYTDSIGKAFENGVKMARKVKGGAKDLAAGGDLQKLMKDIKNPAKMPAAAAAPKGGKGGRKHAKGIKRAAEGTEKNTRPLKDGIKVKNDDITHLKELMELRTIQNFSFEKLNVNVSNKFGDIHETADLDGWMDNLTTTLEGAVSATMGGVMAYES